MNIKKINSYHYIVEDTKDLVERVNRIVDELSNGDKTQFIGSSNVNLQQVIVSRLVAIEFFKEHKIDPDVLTVIVDVNFDGSTYCVSLGTIPDVIDGKVKIAESTYLR